MQGFLKVRRLCLLIIINFLLLICGSIINAAFFLGDDRKLNLRARCVQFWSRLNCLVLGIHISSSGPPAGDDIFFVVSNHCSYIDILVIGAVLPAAFLSKSEVSSWFFVGRIVRLAGTVFVNRGSKADISAALNAVKERLDKGISVVVFPEGTTNNGLVMKSFKSAFFEAAVESRVPVLPLSVLYSHINGSEVTAETIDSVAWHSDMEFLPHFWNLIGLGRIDARIFFSPPLYALGADRKALTSSAFEKVREGLQTINQELAV